MRLRRLTEKKKNGSCHVSDEVVADYKSGGEPREWLEIALLQSIKAIGLDRKLFKAVKVG